MHTLHSGKMVLPVLDYGAAVWDPHQAKYIVQLERVQRFAARAITGNWVPDATPLLQRLNGQVWSLADNTSR